MAGTEKATAEQVYQWVRGIWGAHERMIAEKFGVDLTDATSLLVEILAMPGMRYDKTTGGSVFEGDISDLMGA